MACIHTVSSSGAYDMTVSVGEWNAAHMVETFLSVLNHFGCGGRVELYDGDGNIVDYVEV